MKDLDRLSALFFLFFGIFIAFESFKLPLGRFDLPKSGFFPFGLALTLLFLSGILLIQTLKKGRVKEYLVFGEGKRRMVITIAAMLAYVFFLNHLGYMISTFLIMVLILKGIEKQKWRTTLLISLLSVVISYVSFSWWLGIPLPKGILQFN